MDEKRIKNFCGSQEDEVFLPELTFCCASMVDFAIDRRFDVITCFFSAIGYANTLDKMRQTLRTMRDHLVPGGIVLDEPWLSPAEYRSGAVFASFVDLPDLKVARINTNVLRENVSVLEFHYLVGTPQDVEHFTETHEWGLYSGEEYIIALQACGLETFFEPTGLPGRGVYIGRQP